MRQRTSVVIYSSAPAAVGTLDDPNKEKSGTANTI